MIECVFHMVFLSILTVVTASIPRRAKDTRVENCCVAQCICQYWGLLTWQLLGRFSFALLHGFFLSMISTTLLSHIGKGE